MTELIPKTVAEFPARIGSQSDAMICQFAGTRFEPKVTAQIA